MSQKLKKEFFEGIKHGRVEKTKTILEEGLNVNVTDENSETALHDGAWRGQSEIVNLLLEFGAKVNKPDAYGRTPLHWACWDGKPDSSIVKMLLQAGADVNSRDKYGHIALHHASEFGDTDTVLALLKKGARINEQNDSGWTPLHEACVYNRGAVVDILLAKGANVNIRNSKGDTALHIAVLANADTSLIDKLLDEGADINATNKNDKTPYELQFNGWWTKGVIDEEDLELRARTKDALVKHIIKLKAAGLPCSICMNDIVYTSEEFQVSCYEELHKLQDTVIFEYFSLVIIFLKRNEPYYLKTEQLRITLETFLQFSDLRGKFPIYGQLLKLVFKSTKSRYDLLTAVSDSLKRLEWYSNIPDLVEKQILSYLSDADLKNFITSVEL